VSSVYIIVSLNTLRAFQKRVFGGITSIGVDNSNHQHRYETSASRGVPVHIAAFASTHCAYPQRDGQAELTWVNKQSDWGADRATWLILLSASLEMYEVWSINSAPSRYTSAEQVSCPTRLLAQHE